MDSVKLQEAELAEMKQFYLEEYDRISRRLVHITAILNRLGVKIPDNGLEELSSFWQFPRKPVSAPAGGKKQRKRSGRKSKWELLIMKRLRQLDKPVTYEELTDEIMAASRIPDQKRNSTKQAVVNVVFRLRNRDKKLNTFSVGTREKYIALRSWFDSKGEIKKEYAAKIKPARPASKSGKGRSGRSGKKS